VRTAPLEVKPRATEWAVRPTPDRPIPRRRDSWHYHGINHHKVIMKTFPLPAILAAIAAVLAAPFSLAAGITLFVTAGLGFIIHADYALRYRRIRLPRSTVVLDDAITCEAFVPENHCLAA
jgi:hypothetical protein